MNLTWYDWSIVVLLLSALIGCVQLSKSYMRSVADFLAAGRTAGRYLISVAQGMAGLGAITIVGYFEMFYISGFSLIWWGFTMAVVVLAISVSGWVLYRFRQTRSLTLAQFFEVRYSRRFRIFAGTLSFISGVINFGIFPAVGARFFIWFCGLPHQFILAGAKVATFPIVMAILLALSLYFIFAGGQIAVIFTDFLQGIFVNVVFILIVAIFLLRFDWQILLEGVSAAPPDASLINPFKTSQVKDFNFWYFLIGIIGAIYNTLSWQGTQGYHTSAKSAHEAKMGSVLSNWRTIPQTTFLLFIPVIAFTVMHHASFSPIAREVEDALAAVSSKPIRSQLIVPLVLTHLLPKGLMGAFTAVILAAFISNHTTYLHSWGSILIQDIIMPWRKKPFAPQQHIGILRYAILAVAVFIFCFSMVFKQSEYIFLFFAVTGAIFAGGSGAVIIGGLYWRRGTTAAAWTAMITGSTIAVGGIVLQQLVPNFPLNGQVLWGIAMAASALSYVSVSLLGKRRNFDMDRLLHRGKYLRADEMKIITATPQRGWKMLGMGKEFTRGDKAIYIATYIWTFSWTVVFIIGTIIHLTRTVNDTAWMKFWYAYLWLNGIAALMVVIWFSLGGWRDLRAMFRILKTQLRDDTDDGFVTKTQQNS